MVLYGTVSALIGFSSTLLVGSLLAAISLFCLYRIWLKIFGRNIAFFASILTALHPVYWYYSSRPLLPNSLFISLLIIGVYILVCRPVQKREYLNDVIGPLIICLGVLVRPNELWWIGLSGLIVLVILCANISKKQIALWMTVALLSGAVAVIFNQYVYGVSAGAYVVSQSLPAQSWLSYIFPFGVNIQNILSSTWVYLIALHWWSISFAVLGFVVFLFGKKTKEQYAYASVLCATSLFLIVYYGSNYDVLFSSANISVAYERYWLPIFVLGMPYVIFSFFAIPAVKKYAKALSVFLVIVFLWFSIPMVYGGPDGLLAVRAQKHYMQQVKGDVLGIVPAQAVIATDREDKFFWPERDVVVRVTDPAIGKATAEMLEKGFEMYYFTYGDGQISSSKQEHFDEYGLDTSIEKVFKDHTLYKFSHN